MKVCPNCQNRYPDDGNFCPREGCATAEGPRRLVAAAEEPPPRFTLGALRGGGQSGEVWQAHDAQTGEEIAYKLVAPQSLPTPVAVDRALRELKQLMRSQNPRIAKIIDCGKTSDGQMFVATELVTGETLEQLIERGPLPLERAKKIIAQIGEALLEGQKVGVVHRDLSAKNVLIGAGDEIKLINFVTPRSVSATVFGVPEYLSPEQAEGKLVDQRSNTYSLGAIMTLLLTGTPPFSGPDAPAVLEQVLHAQVTPPSQRRPELTPEIDRVILKALDKNASRRPLTMRQFLNDVASLTPAGAVAVASFGANRPAGAGLAKTMMFAGGAPDIQKLVAEATAARAEANGSGPAAGFSPAVAVAAAPAAAQPVASRLVDDVTTPPPPSAGAAAPEPAAGLRRSHGAAIAATMVSFPVTPSSPLPAALGGRAAPAGSQSTPAPVAAGHHMDEASAGKKPQGGQGANFRETLWFKKGDVEQMVADAKAKAANVSASKGRAKAAVPAELPVEDAKPLEDRYVDDGSVTVEDRKNFSLRSGGTSAGLPTVGAAMPGERMTEAEMLNEIGGRKKMVMGGIAIAVIVGAVAVIFVAFKGKHIEKSVEKGAAAIEPVTRPAETPPPAAAPPAPPAPAQPAAADDDAEAPQAKEATTSPAAAKARAARKKAAAKRNAAKKKQRL
jgi:hypothetical protein